MKKKLAALWCAVCLAAGTVFSPVTGMAVYAEEGGMDGVIIESGDYTYHVTDMGTAEILKYSGTDKDLVIPDKLDGLNVTGIGRDALNEICYTLESIVIPGNVRNIEWDMGMFLHCPVLKKIIVDSENNDYISEDGILYDKEKTVIISCPPGKEGEIYLPESVKEIGRGAFTNVFGLTDIIVDSGNSCFSSEDGILYDKEKTAVIQCPEGKTGEVHLPEGLQSIEGEAFAYCSRLTLIEIPDSVCNIETSSFWQCYSLQNIHVDPKNSDYSSENGVLYNKDMTILLAYPCGRHEGTILPESLIHIGRTAFYHGQLSSIEIPEGVTSIEWDAFFNCRTLESIKIPKSMEIIKGQAFFGCLNLKNVYYTGSEEEWKNITIEDENNECLTNARVHYNYCAHTYESSVMAEPTCSSAGVKTFTCTKCGDTYTEEITKTAHIYKNGTCSVCGQADPAAANPLQTAPGSGLQAEQIIVPTPKFSVCKNIKGKRITLKWKKVSKASGYRIQYSADKKFKKKKEKDCKKNTFTIKTLKKGKKYYVRIQAYRIVSGKRYNSGWSKAKGVKVAK